MENSQTTSGKSSYILQTDHIVTSCYPMRYKGYNTGKRARRKNLRHPRERFLVRRVGDQ
jgi:repressor of nif and glnA expression